MAKAKVQLPDGRIATIEIPDGMSMEEAQAELETMYDTQPEAFAAPAEEPGMLDRVEQFASTYIPPYAAGKGIANALQGRAPETNLEAYGAGIARSGRDMVAGGRQAFNKLTGDDEELAELNAQEVDARAKWDAMGQDHPISSTVGRVAGGVGIPAAVALAAPVGAVGAGMGLGARMLAGGASGAAGGYTAPLTTEEEAGGQRTRNAVLGGTIGAAVPLVGRGVSKFGNSLRKVNPEEATRDFAERALGASRDKGSSAAYKAIPEQVDNRLNSLRKELSSKYDLVEAVKGRPVTLQSSSRLSDEALSLPEEVSAALSPTARRVAAALKKGATKTSAILDETGQPIREAKKVDFKDVRDTIRELRGAKRALPYTDAGIQNSRRIDAIIQDLDDDLVRWGNASESNARTLAQAKAIDSEYAEKVAPFLGKDTPIGKFRSTAMDEKAVASNFLRDNSGQAAEDLVNRVPESKGPMRELYGHNLLTERGPTAQVRATEGGTLAEALLSKPERAYLGEVADSSRRSVGAATMFSPTLERFIRAAGLEKVDTMLHGVQKYGTKTKPNGILADMLRAYGVSQTTTGE